MPLFPQHRVPFNKYQGTGNDFVLISWNWDALPTSQSVVRICDRRTGIGADGLLLLTPPENPDALARMILFNPDGSRPEMCGNGLRCAAMHVAQHYPNAPARFIIQTDAGLRLCEILSPATPCFVRVAMGPVSPPEDLRLDDPPVHLMCLSVGNPHAVLVHEVPPSSIAMLGPAIGTHPAFPQGVNVGFPSNLTPQSFDLAVFERGAGLTRACGTGACAATVALASAGLLKTTTQVRVRLPGGQLVVDYDPTTRQATLTGEACRVFDGTIAWPPTL
jgi:diaminopimelate epimerase